MYYFVLFQMDKIEEKISEQESYVYNSYEKA